MMGERVLDGRYRLDEQLWREEQVVCWRASDQRTGRTVRVRLLDELPPAELDAWRQGLAAAALPPHPGLAVTLDASFSGEMYLVEADDGGLPLAQMIGDGEVWDPARVGDFCRRLAEALDYLHQAGLSHGSLGPWSILVDPDDRPIVIDVGRPATPAATVRRARYQSPEQSLGEPTSPAADVFALSVVAYRLLTGRVPFDGPNAVAIGTLQNTTQAPQVSNLCAACPAGLAQAVTAGLAADRTVRPGTAASWLSRLAAAIPVPTTPIEPPLAPPPLDATVAMPSAAIAAGAAAPPTQPDWTPAPPVTPPGPVEAADTSGSSVGAWLAGLVVVGLVSLLIFGPKYFSNQARVPALQGLTRDEAAVRLTEAGLAYEIAEEVYDEQVPLGGIVTQSPPAGSRVEQESLIRLVVSKGSRNTDVPSVVGLSLEQARSRVVEAGLAVGEVRDSFAAGQPEGTITAQQPAPGTQASRDTRVVLFVNRTKPEPAAEAPQEPAAGLVDEAVGQLKDRAGEAVEQAAEELKQRAGESAEQFKERAREGARRVGEGIRERLREGLRGDSGAAPEVPAEQPDPPADEPAPATE